MEAAFSSPEGGGFRCGLCPHACLLLPGKRGVCKVREGSPAGISLPYAGLISSEAMDPVEKKPLYHYYPGRQVYSIGFWGCNLSCPFCQNWQISQDARAEGLRLSPGELAERARASGAIGIAYTYSEPLVHLEFLREAATAARAQGLKNVLVSNGCVSAPAAGAILPLMDAANIDLKAWSPEAYRKVLGGSLESVKEFVALAAEAIHLEITTLVVPGLSDSLSDISAIAAWIASLSKDIPWHLSAYRPAWKSSLPPTSLLVLSEALKAARRHLPYVYPGNAPSLNEDTRCPVCGAILVKRKGFAIELGELKNGRCTRCGAAIPIIGA